jgi:TonB-dependent SusC/RagA subfamily outer membrane receptor
VPAGSLLDTANVRRWFELFTAGLPDSLYTYQLPLSQASGPSSASLDTDLVMFSSYSYLGLIGNERIRHAVENALRLYGTSTGGVRLLTGTLALHQELERELADFLGHQGAAVFASGYDANIAAITSLFSAGDVAILDQYAHQSIVDGVRIMSGNGGLLFLNPADIETIEVLKDMASLSFYGIQGANGVVLITTKRGR